MSLKEIFDQQIECKEIMERKVIQVIRTGKHRRTHT